MSITAKVYLEHPNLALVPTIRRVPDAQIRVIMQGTTDPGATAFPFLIDHPEPEAVETALSADPTVAHYECIDRTGAVGIYRIEHSSEARLISSVVTRAHGLLMRTETEDGGWVVHLLLPDREALNAVWTYAGDQEMRLDIIEIYTNESADGAQSYGLTMPQREAIQTAFARGYFNEPRDISLTELADEMGLSSTAMSGRLRRGLRNLIGATIGDGHH
jgi:predicted DNA binding protein